MLIKFLHQYCPISKLLSVAYSPPVWLIETSALVASVLITIIITSSAQNVQLLSSHTLQTTDPLDDRSSQ